MNIFYDVRLWYFYAFLVLEMVGRRVTPFTDHMYEQWSYLIIESIFCEIMAVVFYFYFTDQFQRITWWSSQRPYFVVYVRLGFTIKRVNGFRIIESAMRAFSALNWNSVAMCEFNYGYSSEYVCSWHQQKPVFKVIAVFMINGCTAVCIICDIFFLIGV